MRFLRTNTAIRLTVGPFFDKTDGVTPETGLTVTSCKLTLMVDDANVPTLVLDTAPTASGGANDMVHVTGDDAGFYDLELAAANVNYLGRAMLAITDAATHCPVFHEFMILPAMVYDSMVLGTDTLNADVTQFGGTNLTAAAGIPEVKVNNIAANAITAASIATDAIDADAIADNAINAAAIAADAITDAKVASDVTIASVTGAVGSVTGNVGGNVTGSIGSVATGGITAGSIAADAIGASELAADAITEIQSGLATAAGVTAAVAEVNVASIDANVITETAIANDAFTADKFAAAAFTAAKFATDAIDANALAADAVGEIQNGLATSANQTAIINLLSGVVLASGTIGATGNTTTTLHLAGIAWANDDPNSLTLVIKDASTGLFYSRWIEDWADTGDLATVATLPFTPQASTDLYWILPMRSDVTGGSGLDAAGVRAAVGLASANLDTQLDALPTNAELATALGTADDAVLAAIAALNNLSQANIRTALGMASANFDTQIGDLPTNAELATALGTADDAVLAAVAALNNLSSAQAQTAAAAALSAYDPPTRTEATADKDEVIVQINANETKIDTLQTSANAIEADTQDLQSRTPAALTAGGNIKADALAIDGSTTAADRLQRSAEAIAFATVGSGSTTTSIVTSAIDPSATVADQFKGRIVIFDKATTTAALRGQATDITASTSGGVLTCTALTNAPASGDTFTIT